MKKMSNYKVNSDKNNPSDSAIPSTQISDRIDQKILAEIISSVQQINYGEVIITLHNSEIVQIERREKKRF